MAEQGEQPQGESQEAPEVESKLDALLERTEPPEPQEPEAQPAEAEGGEQTPATPAEEFEEIDFESEKYRVPKKLKDAFLRQSDYTKKTQEISEARSMVALQIQAMQHEQQFQNAIAPDLANLQQLDAAIKQYNGINWSQLTTDQLVQTKHQLDQLKEQKSEQEKLIQSKRHQFGQHIQNLNGQQAQKANEWLSKQIPSWGEATVKSLNAYGMTEGFTEAELSSIRDPRYVKTLWKAQQYDKLLAEKNTVTKRAQSVPPVISPTAAAAKATTGTKLSEAIKTLHQAKTPQTKKAAFDKAFELKMEKMGIK